MACGCKPTITPGVCNRTINLCRYSPMTVLAVNPVCNTLPYNLTIVEAIGNIIYSIVNDGKSIAINSDETTDELAYITYTYNCNGVQQTCTLTINVQDRIEGTHAIELNACSSTCSLGDTTYLWTGFTDGCVELMPGYSATDCQIKVLVYEECAENLNNVISLEVCCGACLDGCCKTTTWTWNPPTFNDNCDADCTMYPCTVYDPVTGNCVSSCEECQTCCNVGGQNSVPITMTCIKVDEQNYTLDFNTFTLTGEWILAKIEDVEENGDCLLVTDWEVFDTSIINEGGDGAMNFIYIDNGHMQITIQTDDIPDGGGAVLIGYKVGDCTRWYAFQVLALADQTPSNHCLGTFVFNEYVLEHNELADTPLPLCNTCTQSSSSYCADCCDNSGCVKENCTNQPVCSSGECKCFIGQLEVPALPNGCCPAECTEDTIIPTCSTCVSGVIIPAPVCTETFVLNTNTCLCECPSGTVFDALTLTCIQVNCNVPGNNCDPCFNCVEGVCTPLPCEGVEGMITNPLGNGTVEEPCCIPDPCPNCIASLEVNKYCTDVLPRRANVSADATNYRIKFTQIQLNYLPLYSQVNCEYEALQAIAQTNNLTNTATYEINYTNYVLDWVPVTPSGTTLIIPQSAGNGFLIKCSWKGREVVYEFIFEEGFNGSADQLVLGEYPIQVRKVKDLTCGNVYGLSGDCQTTSSWEFTQAALNTSGQFITDNPIVVHATGPDAEVCVNAIAQANGIVCEETQVCADVDECQGACGCDPCNGGGTLFSTISQVTASDTLIFYASVFRDCGNGDELPIMFTCAPPTAVEYTAYINSGGDTLPDGCGTLPQMFDSKPACANCEAFNCSVPGTSPDPATQLCGWWVDTTLLVPNSLVINGANIEFEILPAIEMLELCFGTNTECGYVCSCTIIENPEYDPEPPCNFAANITSECTEAGYVQALAVHMTGGMAPYTIQYNIDREDIGGAHTNILPSGGNNGSLSVVTSLLNYTLMGFGVDVQGGCLWYDITITDSSPIPCVVNLTACTPCSPTVSFKCESGTCVDPGDGTGEYATADLCKSAGCCGVAMNIDNIITCIDSNGATIPLSNSPTLSCVSAGVINSITSSPPGFSYLSATNSISYIAGTSPGVYTLTADWTCGTCTGEDIFTVTINTTLITVSDITNDCNAQSPLSVNLYSAIQGGNNTNTIFKVADLVGNPVCDSSGSLSGGVLLTDVESTNWATAGIVYYEYTDNNTGCNKCGSFVVTINDCCNTSMTINDVSGCLSDGSVDITATFTPDCTVNGGITDLIEPINPSNVWGITGTHPNYTISYPSNVIQGAHRLEATWECGTCTGTELFFVNINPNPTVTVPSSYTGICPFDLNSLLSNITPLGGTTIFKTGSTCTNNGTLSGGTDVLTPNNYSTVTPNQPIQYQYTTNGCSVCGEFTVTCCSANAGDNTNQTYCY